jgi:hypothetical protein
MGRREDEHRPENQSGFRYPRRPLASQPFAPRQAPQTTPRADRREAAPPVAPPAPPRAAVSTEPLEPLATFTLPALRVPATLRPQPKRTTHWYHDRWLIALLICASCASIGSAWWAFHFQTILLYSDAHSHLQVARRVLDNITPGVAQLGDIWLPLPHIIMLPLIWNDYLWRTGLAGTLSSMPCYVVAACYVFATARRLTQNSRASFIGTLVFILNPNILYLQSTPLSEPVLFATLAAASYYFLVWVQGEKLRDLVVAAFCTFLATLARYDGWALFMAFLVFIVFIGWRKHQPRAKIAADLVLFGTLGGFGIALWFLWNWVIFGSPIYFLNGPFSSDVQTKSFIANGLAETYHNLWQSLRTYSLASSESIGPALFILGIVAVGVFVAQRRFSPESLAALTILVPFAFYVVAFFTGQDVMYVPYANHPPYYVFYNARFGAEMAAPAAVFIATLAHSVARRFPVGQLALVGIIAVQSAFISWGGVVSLQDGQYGLSCAPGHQIAAFLAQHYDGGAILMDVFHSNIDLSVAQIPFKEEIYEGDGLLWKEALNNPTEYVQWIVIKPGDLVSQHINIASPALRAEYVVVAQDTLGGAKLLHRVGLPPLPNRPLPSDVLSPYIACGSGVGRET